MANELKKLFNSRNEVYVLRVWSLLVQLLGKVSLKDFFLVYKSCFGDQHSVVLPTTNDLYFKSR